MLKAKERKLIHRATQWNSMLDVYKSPPSVTITQADNGYVVSCYTEKGEKRMVAKDLDEALKNAEGMMLKKGENYKETKEKANKMAMKK